MAERACHIVTSTTRFGLTQVLATMGPALFAAGSLLSLLLAAAVSVYAFDFIEPMWGRFGSFTVLALLAAACTAFGSIAFGLVSGISRRFSSNRGAVALGTVAALCALAALVATTRLGQGGISIISTFGAFMVASGIAPFAVRRQGG